MTLQNRSLFHDMTVPAKVIYFVEFFLRTLNLYRKKYVTFKKNNFQTSKVRQTIVGNQS